MTSSEPDVVDWPDRSRYEIAIGDQVAFLDYRHRDGRLVLLHLEVPETLRGRGLANVLAKHALDGARTAAMPVVVRCPFVTTWLRRHPEYDDLVVARVADAQGGA